MSVREHGPGDLSSVCGTLFQDPESQVVMGGVRAEVALALEHRGEPPAAVARAVEEAALALGIGQLLERRADTLSGGELQRVALAAALAHRPRLLLLDEPTSQLDPVAGDELIWLLRRLNEEWGTTVLLTEHRLERCLPAADRVLALDEGQPRVRRAAGATSWPGRRTRARRSPRPPRGCSHWPGCGPLPASVKEARAALRERGHRARASEPDRRTERERRRRRRPEQPARSSCAASGTRSRTARRSCAASTCGGARRAGGADGPQRRGQEHAAQARQGPARAHAREDEQRRRGGAAAPEPGRLPDPRARARGGGRGRAHQRRPGGRGDADPRDLSGGERQRLALEVVLSGGEPPAVVCLDEPTRGMDRARKEALALRLHELAKAARP